MSRDYVSIIRKIGLIILISGVLAGLANFLHPRKIPWVQNWAYYVEARAVQAGLEIIPLGLADFLHKAGNHLFIDARPSTIYDKGHITDAISFPFEEMDDQLLALEQVLFADKPLVIYCQNRACDDALLLAIELREMGQSNLLYYVDGYELWEESGCPTETK